ncbi:tyrosine-type recombinase/integrase [Lewinella sp. 4G2]|uniref:tyrosine-type recombinase/integrase n=1 Tax=Lewinella sp. 4G2 TaxID=1803372 RepID=UPI0018D3678D|nr:tyrosine-type recombinase/integrase [Lewinella sp. 4G2]
MARPRTRILNLERPQHENYLRGLVDELVTLGYAEKSAASHHWVARRFLCWTEKHGAARVELTKRTDLEAYRTHVGAAPSLRDGGPVSDKTVYQNMRTVQLLFDYLLRIGAATADPFATFRMNQPKRGAAREILTAGEVRAMYAACDRLGERALLSLTYGCGLRVGELERLNAEDVRLTDGLLVVERGKNAKRRLIPLSAGVLRDLKHYDERRTGREPAFLRHGRGGRLRAHTAQKWLKRLAWRAMITKAVSVHVMRHSIASHLLAGGMPVEEVRVFLGHALLATTERYTRVGMEQLTQIVGDGTD